MWLQKREEADESWSGIFVWKDCMDYMEGEKTLVWKDFTFMKSDEKETGEKEPSHSFLRRILL